MLVAWLLCQIECTDLYLPPPSLIYFIKLIRNTQLLCNLWNWDWRLCFVDVIRQLLGHIKSIFLSKLIVTIQHQNMFYSKLSLVTRCLKFPCVHLSKLITIIRTVNRYSLIHKPLNTPNLDVICSCKVTGYSKVWVFQYIFTTRLSGRSAPILNF